MPPWTAQNYSDTAARARKLAGRSLFTLGSGLCTAGVAVAKAAAAGIQTLTSDHSDREKVTFARVAELTWSDPVTDSERRLPVALLGYTTGFQLWSLEDRDGPAELVSTRRDGAVRWLEPVPEPRSEDPTDGPLLDTRPLLAVVPAPAPVDDSTPGARQPSMAAAQQQHRVQLYSLRTQGVVRTLTFGSEVLAVLCSSRVLVVALRGQLQAFDAATLEHTFSVLTYVAPPSRQQHQHQQHAAGAGGGERHMTQQHEGQDGTLGPLAGAACALGPRWLAYAADQAVQQSGCQARAQRLPVHRRDSSGSSTSRTSSLPLPATSPGSMGGSVGSPGGALTSAAVAEAAREYAKKSGQHLAAGLAAAGSASYKYLSVQYKNWRSGAQQGTSAQQSDSAVAGTVMVRDVVTRAVVCHFRAHTSPLAALQFTPDATMLATASVAGHNVNMFRIVPPAPGSAGALLDCEGGGSGGIGGGGGFGGPAAAPGYAVHLFRLHRGVTPALIQSITFAPDASWAAVTSGRGTCHVFHLAQQQQAGAPARAASAPLDSLPSQQLGAAAGGAAAGLQRAGSGRGQAGLQQQPRVEDGIMGQPIKLVALGRAGGKAGLLGSGIAGAATSAALSVYGQQTGVLPAAAAFLPGKPGSPRALSAPHHPYLPQDSCGSSLSLLVVSPEGLLTRHLLRAPSVEDGLRSGAAAAAGHAPHINAHYPPNGTTRDVAATGDMRAVAALQEDARWDICRQHGWQEREEMPPTLLPSQAQPAVDVHSCSEALLGGSAPVSPRVSERGGGSVAGEGGAAAVVDPAWLAQAEGAPPRDPCAGPPLWADPQFRLLALPSQPRHAPVQHPQHQPPTPTHWSCDGMGNGSALSVSPGCLRLGTGAEYLNNFGGMAYGRPGSSLSSASSAAAGGHWDSH